MAGIRRQKLWDRFFIVYGLFDDDGESQHQYVRVRTVVRQGGLNIICEDLAQIAVRTKEIKEAMDSLKLSTTIFPPTCPSPPPDETYTIEF